MGVSGGLMCGFGVVPLLVCSALICFRTGRERRGNWERGKGFRGGNHDRRSGGMFSFLFSSSFFFHFISLSCFIHVNVGFLPIFYFLML